MALAETARFGFGKNWSNFVEADLTDERVDIARRRLLDFLGVAGLAGKNMIDVGCGSGIHSLAAIKSGVDWLVSFDFDPLSVSATNVLRRRAGEPSNWRVEQGSVLDGAYLATLGEFDLVYSWGVLHHTGDMLTALENVTRLVAPKGKLFIALYAAEPMKPSPEFWIKVKRRYNAGGTFTRRAIESWYVARSIAGMLRRKQNPVAFIRNYKTKRGMSYLTDVRDWVGGWPMEFSTTAQIRNFYETRGFDLIRLREGEANTEYLFANGRHD
jgi:SAM-dependent methyltransferase